MPANDFEPRQAPDDLSDVSYTTADGATKTIRAKDGLLKPKDAEGDAALASLGYPIARSKKVESLTALRKRAAKAGVKGASRKQRAELNRALAAPTQVEEPKRDPDEFREVGDQPAETKES